MSEIDNFEARSDLGLKVRKSMALGIQNPNRDAKSEDLASEMHTFGNLDWHANGKRVRN